MGCSISRRKRQREFQKINQRRSAPNSIQCLSIKQIESRFERKLAHKKDLAEAFLLGKNKYGKADITPAGRQYK